MIKICVRSNVNVQNILYYFSEYNLLVSKYDDHDHDNEEDLEYLMRNNN